MNEAHQDRLLARADKASDAAERVVRQIWRELLAVIRAGGPHFEVARKAAHVLRSLPKVSAIVLDELAATAQDAATWTAREMGVPLLEDFREVDRLPLPPLPLDRIREVVYAAGWTERVAALTRLAEPDVLAARIANGVASGRTTAEIARDIRPALQGVQSAARRTARTAGLWIAHEAELHVYDQFGDMIVGYQIHAVLDHATRPEHRRRDGWKYYRNPKGNQRGFDQMPRPPREADGSWAYNCRCWLEPILRVE